MISVIDCILMISGSIFVLIAGIGIVRLPDTLCRLHALSKALTLGIVLILLSLIGELYSTISTIKMILAIGFNFITIPLASHIFALYHSKRAKTKSEENS